MERELSPFSARRLLTQKLAAERNGGSQHSSVSRDHSRDTSVQNGKRDQPPKEPFVASGSLSKSRTESIRPNDTSSDRNLQRKVPSTTEAGAPRGPHDPSPEPYRRPRASSREIERKRDKSPDRKRNSSRDRRRDRPRDRSRDRSRGKLMDSSRDRKRDTSREKRRSRSREGRRGHSRDRRRDGSREKDSAKDKRRDRSADKHRHGHSRRHRSRSRDSHRKDRERDTRRSRSPLPYRSRKQRTRSPSASTSPPPKRRRRTRSPSRSPHRRVKKPLPSQEVSFRGLDDSAQPPSKYGGAPPNKERPNFNTTGMLAKHANRVEGTKISLKYHEPAEARKPPSSQPWRMFVFKGDDVVDTIELAQKSCWLLGRSHEVVDYVLEHPSSSGQHAVIQFRYIQKTVEDEFGVKSQRGKVKPYVIDLESSNGTELNGETVEASRYFELRDKDILKFAGCEREYVIMLPPPEAR